MLTLINFINTVNNLTLINKIIVGFLFLECILAHLLTLTNITNLYELYLRRHYTLELLLGVIFKVFIKHDRLRDVGL